MPPEQAPQERPSEARPRKFAPDRKAAAPAVAALRMEPVVVWVIQRVSHFPRNHKFTVGDRWIDTCLDVQSSLVQASYIRDKRALLSSASRGLVRASVLASVAARSIGNLTSQIGANARMTPVDHLISSDRTLASAPSFATATTCSWTRRAASGWPTGGGPSSRDVPACGSSCIREGAGCTEPPNPSRSSGFATR
jgi:hypothetical protein